MKLRCIRSLDKLFLKDKIYEVKGTKINRNEVFYNIKDEDDKYGFVILNGLYWEFEIVEENEMKELTLQQAFECKIGTKFEVIYDDGETIGPNLELNRDEDDILYFEWINGHSGKAILTPEKLTAKYIPIVEEKEVSFMEAVKAFDDGKNIKSVWGNDEYVYDGSEHIELIDNNDEIIQCREILKAKWYIID